MTTSLKYTGSAKTFFELAVTGQARNWVPQQQQDVSDSDAALLLTTGLFYITTARARTAAQLAAAPSATDAAMDGEFFLNTDPSQRYVINAAKTGFASSSGSGTGISTLSSATDYNANLVAPLAAKLAAPTAWAASAAGGTPTLTSGTAVLGASYRNTTAGLTTFTTAIDGIPSVQQDDWLVCFAAGTYTLVPKDMITAAQRTAGATAGFIAVDSAGVTYKPDGSVLASGGGATAATYSSNWTTSGSQDMGLRTISAAIALVSDDTSTKVGGYTQAAFITDGSHTPTIDGTPVPGWPASAGLYARIELKNTGNGIFWTTTAGAIPGRGIVTPAAPVITTAPVISPITAGAAVTWTAGAVTGSPLPTVTYSLKKNGSVVSSPATSGSYNTTALSDVFVVTQAATNSQGTATPVPSAGVTVSAATPAALVGPVIGLIGDSITAYGNYQQAVPAATTFTRSGGAITATISNILYGYPEVYLQDMNDPTYEVMGRNTYASGAVAIATSSGASDTSTGTTTGITHWGRFTPRGIWSSLFSLFKGGIEFGGNYGHPGGNASAMSGPTSSQVAYALSRTPQLCIVMAGVNDAKLGGATGLSVYTSVKAIIDQLTAAGVPVVVCAITPLGTGYTAITENIIGDPNSSTITTSANVRLKAYCAANQSLMVFADTFTDLCDKSGGTGNWVLYASMTPDQIHPRTNAAMLMAARVQTAMSTFVTAPTLLPTTSTDTGSVNGHSRFLLRGPWVTTTGGTFSAGCTGSLPPAWTANRAAGSACTSVSSIVDPGDSKGMKVQVVCTPTAANDALATNIYASATLSSLGLAIGDEIALGVEIDWSNAVASGLGAVNVILQSNTSGLYGYASTGELPTAPEPAGNLPDTMTGRIMMTGWIKITSASFTALSGTVNAVFASAPGPAATISIRRATIFKR